MNIQEIATKTNVSQEEMEFLISEYIYERKGYRPMINLLRNLPVNQIPEPMLSMIIQQQLQLLTVAFNVACEYYANKND